MTIGIFSNADIPWFLCLSWEVYGLLKMAASEMISKDITSVGQKTLSQDAGLQIL